MSNILIVPDSGSIYFTTGSAGNSAIPNLSSGVAFKFDNSAGVNITSYATGVSDNDRFSIDGYNGRLFNVSDNLTGIIFSVNDGAGLPIIEVDSGAVDKVTMGTYGTNTFVIDGNKVGIGTGVPAAKLDIFDNVLAGSAGLAGSVLNLNQTWNTTGAPSAIKLNVTDTASNTASKLLDLQIGTVSKFSVDKSGGIKISDATTVGGSDQKYLTFNTVWGEVIFTNWGGQLWILGQGLTTFSVNSPAYFTTHIGLGGNKDTADVKLWKDASNILAQRNGVNAQAFRLYNTYTDATTFERLNIKWDTNALKIGTEKGISGGVARAMEFQTDGTTRMTIKEDGNVGVGTTNPLYPLHILGNTNAVVRARVENTGPAIFQAIAGTSKVASFSVFNGVVWDAGVDTDQKFKIAGPNGDVALLSTNTRLAIDSSGNIGIGTITPQNKLDVNGDTRLGGWLHVDRTGGSITSYLALRVRGASEAGNFGNAAGNGQTEIQAVNTSGLVIGTNGTSPIILAAGGVERMRVLGNNGNVGIGTTIPTANFQVNQSTNGVGTISVAAGGTTITGNSTQFLNTFKVGDTITSAGQTLTISSIASDSSMTTSAAGAAISGAAYTLVGGSRFSVAGNGDIALGSFSLIQKIYDLDGVNANRLLVNGNLAFGGGGLMIRSSTINSSSRLVVACPNNAQATSAYLFGIDGLQLNKGLIYTNSDQSISLVNGSGGNNDTYTRILNITSAGNVGIGTTTPTQKLEISGGNILSSGTVTGTSGLRLGVSTSIQTANGGAITWGSMNSSGGNTLTFSDFTDSIFFHSQVSMGSNRFNLAGGYIQSITTGGPNNVPTMLFSASQGSDAGNPIFRFTSGSNYTEHRLFGVGSGVTYTEHLTVISNGKVGIGTTTPAARLDIVDSTLAGSGSLAGSVLNIAQTWNTTGAPTAIKLNVTNTASDAASNLLDLQIDGISRLKITKNGVIDFGSSNTASQRSVINSSSGQLVIFSRGDVPTNAYAGAGYWTGFPAPQLAGFFLGNFGGLQWSAGSFADGGGYDLRLDRDASNTLAQKNGVNPQIFRLYNTHTDATTFERLNLKWDANVLKIGTEKGSAGGVARAMEFQTDATTRMRINDTGNVGIGTTAPLNKLHVEGTANGEGLRVSHSAGGGTRLDIIVGDGSQVAVGMAGFTVNGTTKLLLHSTGLILPEPSIRVGNNPQTFYINGGYSASTLGNSIVLGSNTINGGPFTATSGTQNIVSIGVSGNESWNPASGNAVYNLLRIAPIINTSGTYAGIVRGLYINPTLTSVIGTDFRALDLSNTSGFGIYQSGASANNYFAGNIGIGTTTPTEKLHVLGNIRNVGNLSIYNSDIVTTLDRLTVDGSQGRLFTVTDSLVGSLMSVNDIAGLPILEVFDDDKIVMGEYASNALTVLGKNVGIGTGSPTAKLDILDTVLAGSGSLAGSALNIAQTWNTTGAPTAIKLNVTNTTSGAASNLLDLQVGGVSKFKVQKDGSVIATQLTVTNGELRFLGEANNRFYADGAGLKYRGGALELQGNNASPPGVLSFYTSYLQGPNLVGETHGVIGQINGLNPQAFRVYNTYTSSTNFERLNLRWDTNVVKIGTEKGSAGGVARDLSFETDATTRMTIAASGDISFSNPTQVRTALGFVQLTPAQYAALVEAGTTNPDTIYIVQE